jgi:hypothetical protein
LPPFYITKKLGKIQDLNNNNKESIMSKKRNTFKMENKEYISIKQEYASVRAVVKEFLMTMDTIGVKEARDIAVAKIKEIDAKKRNPSLD